jgi:hypothetical protein
MHANSDDGEDLACASVIRRYSAAHGSSGSRSKCSSARLEADVRILTLIDVLGEPGKLQQTDQKCVTLSVTTTRIQQVPDYSRQRIFVEASV